MGLTALSDIFKEGIRQAEDQEKRKQQLERSSSGKASLEKSIVAANFLIEEVYRRCEELESEFNKETTDVTDEELLRRKEGLSDYSTQLDRLSNKVQKALETIPTNWEDKSIIIPKLKGEYQKVVEKKREYERFVSRKREVNLSSGLFSLYSTKSFNSLDLPIYGL